MPSLKEYFDQVAYKPKFSLGDRVRGLHAGIPFAGSVLVDTLLDEDAGPYLVVNLDLPVVVDGRQVSILKVVHSELIDIKGSYESNRKTNRKKSVVGRKRRSG